MQKIKEKKQKLRKNTGRKNTQKTKELRREWTYKNGRKKWEKKTHHSCPKNLLSLNESDILK